MQALAFRDFWKSRSRARHPQNFTFFGLYIHSKNRAPARDNLIFWRFDRVRIFKNRALGRDILEISSNYLHQNRSKIALPCGAFGEFWSFMNDDVEGFYTNPIPNERRSSWLSWLKREVLAELSVIELVYRICRHRRSKFDRLRDGSYTNSILKCSAQGRLVLQKIALPWGASWKFWKKSRSHAKHPENFEGNHAPMRSILKILKKIALPCGASWKCWRKLHSRAKHPENFEGNRVPMRSILKILKEIALPCGASWKFWWEQRTSSERNLQILENFYVWCQAPSMSWSYQNDARPQNKISKFLSISTFRARRLPCHDFCLFIHTYKRMYIHAHTYIHTYIHAYIHTYIHTYTHPYKHA